LVDDGTVTQLLACLTDPARRVSAAVFPAGSLDADQPGLYAWWADSKARRAISGALGLDVPELIYAGEAGATRWPSGARSSATLRSRIHTNHLSGNVSSSTFRLTLAAILLEDLGLEVVKPEQLSPRSDQALSAWIRRHLHIAIAPYPDRDHLTEVEERVLDRLDPILNIRGRPSSPARRRLTELRRRIRRTPT